MIRRSGGHNYSRAKVSRKVDLARLVTNAIDAVLAWKSTADFNSFSFMTVFVLNLQVHLCPPSARGESRARTWVEETAKAGSGRRRMPKATFPKNGRSTGLS